MNNGPASASIAKAGPTIDPPAKLDGMDSAGCGIQFWRDRTMKKKFDAAFESKVVFQAPQGFNFPEPSIGADSGKKDRETSFTTGID